jgi:hypothetical protein
MRAHLCPCLRVDLPHARHIKYTRVTRRKTNDGVREDVPGLADSARCNHLPLFSRFEQDSLDVKQKCYNTQNTQK